MVGLQFQRNPKRWIRNGERSRKVKDSITVVHKKQRYIRKLVEDISHQSQVSVMYFFRNYEHPKEAITSPNIITN